MVLKKGVKLLLFFVLETKRSKTTAANINVGDSAVSDEANLLDAASRGAVTAVFLG